MLFDVLAGLESLRICTGYKLDGKVLPAFPSEASVLARVEPVYEEFAGFGNDVSDCRQFNELPPQAQAYVKKIESYVGVPVGIISVGPRRDQTLSR